MTRRSGQWHLVGHDSDPVPADGWDVRAVARDYDRRGDELSDAQDILDRLSRLEGWTGEAAEKFAVKSHEATGDLGKAAQKYHDAASALESYAGDVLTARTSTWNALQKAESADATARANPRSGFDPFDPPDFFDPETTPEEAEQERQNQRHDAAMHELADAQREVRQAVEALQGAARRAAEQIRAASDLFKDSAWDNFKGFVRQHADVLARIAEVLEIVAMVVGAIALVVALIVTAPAWLGVALFAAAIALGVALLALHSALWAADTGKAGFGDVALDVVNLATLGMGAKLASLGKAAYGAASSAATRNAVAAAERGLAQNIKNGLRIGNPNNPLRRWAQTRLDDAASAARTTVTSLDDVSVAFKQRVLALDSDAAQAIEQIRRLRIMDQSAEVLRHLDEAARIRHLQVNVLRFDFANNFSQFLDKATGQHVIAPAKNAVNDAVDASIDFSQDFFSEQRWKYTVVGK